MYTLFSVIHKLLYIPSLFTHIIWCANVLQIFWAISRAKNEKFSNRVVAIYNKGTKYFYAINISFLLYARHKLSETLNDILNT